MSRVVKGFLMRLNIEVLMEGWMTDKIDVAPRPKRVSFVESLIDNFFTLDKIKSHVQYHCIHICLKIHSILMDMSFLSAHIM